jgi:inosine-uridine nucleoside N-ribohydrolase
MACAIGDAGALAITIDPSRATLARFPVTLELTGTATRGQVVLGRRTPAQRARLTDWWHTSPAAVDVVTDLDTDYYKACFLRAIGAALASPGGARGEPASGPE